MSFLAPLFLVGALAIAAPIVFHLIRRTSREKMRFSSLMFLQPTPPRVTRSSRLENLFLLLLRCLILCLLALGFARPLLQKPVVDDGGGQGRRIAVVVDASASMRRDALWADARDRARQALKRVGPADTVGVFLLDSHLRPLMSFEQWTAAPMGDRVAIALQKLQEAEPGWSGTHLGRGLLAVTELLEENAGRGQRSATTAPRQIVLITDLQEGMHLDGLQGFEWPRGMEVVLEQLKPKRPSNAGLQLLLEKDEAADSKSDQEVRVRVSNSSDAKREQFQLGWIGAGAGKGFAVPPMDIYVPPGQSRVLTVPRPASASDLEQLQITGDDEDFDNRAYVVNPKPEQVRVLFLGDDGEKDSTQLLYYLRRAFPDTRRQSIQIVSRPGKGPVPPEDLASAPLCIVTDGLGGEGLQAARTFLGLGKPMLFALKSTAGMPALAELIGLGTLSAEESTGANYALLGQVAFDHPLFASFADPRFSDFTKIHFWKHRRLNADDFKNAKVLARFDQGDPALLQVPVSKGLLFVLTSGWHPTDSQFALSSKFVPFLYSLLDLGGGIKAQFAQYVVGDSVTLPATNPASSLVVRKPDGKESKITAGDGRFADTDQPGIYTITAGTNTLRFAVNRDASESRTAPLPLEELERLHLPLHVSSPDQIKRETEKRVHLQAVELEQRQKLWRWLIVTALAVLILETWLAGWLTRRQMEPAPAP